MKPARFAYHRPASLDEALDLLARHEGKASVLAGGQSLVPMLNLRLAQPAMLVDINAIAGLDAIEARDGVLAIGGRARHNDVLRSPFVRAHAPLLTQALTHVSHEAIRNRGTFGGSLALADPAAELPACAIALDATIVASSSGGERTIPAAEFVQGMYTTALRADEILTRIEIPSREGWLFAFEEVSRRHGDFALAALALGLRFEGGTVAEARVVFAGVEGHARRIEHAEAALVGRGVGTIGDFQAGEALADLEPIDGAEYPATYRRRLAVTLLGRLARRLVEEDRT